MSNGALQLRLLDCRVHQLVRGLDVEEQEAEDEAPADSGDELRTGLPHFVDEHGDPVPRYSTDAEASRDLVEYLRESGWAVERMETEVEEMIGVRVTAIGDQVAVGTGIAETREAAIAQGAVEAAEELQGGGNG